jgi:cobalt-precorrin 5A hydrolase
MIVAGIGCRRDAAAASIVAVVRKAEAQAGVNVAMLATASLKANEAGVRDAALQLGIRLMVADEAQIAAVQALCPTRSAVVQRHTGHASIAEAAALAVAGPGATLVLERIAMGDATCAIAASAAP